MLVGVAVFP